MHLFFSSNDLVNPSRVQVAEVALFFDELTPLGVLVVELQEADSAVADEIDVGGTTVLDLEAG